MPDDVNLDSTYKRRIRRLQEAELEAFISEPLQPGSGVPEEVAPPPVLPDAAPALAPAPPAPVPATAPEASPPIFPDVLGAPPEALAPATLPEVDSEKGEQVPDLANQKIAGMTVQELLTVTFPPAGLLLPALQGVRNAVVVAGQNINAMGNWMREFGVLPRGQLMIHLPNIDVPDSAAESLTTTTAQFLAGFLPGMKYTKWLGLTGNVAKGTVAGLLADMAVMDPTQPQIADLITQLVPALRNPVLTYLQSDPTDTRAEQVFKQALQGAVTGAVFDGLFVTVKSMKTALHARRAAMSSGDPALVDAAMKTIDEVVEASGGPDASIVAVRQGDGFADVPRPTVDDMAPPPADIDPTSPFFLEASDVPAATPRAPMERSAAEGVPDVVEEVVEEAGPIFPRARDLPEDLPGVAFPRRTLASQFEPRPVRYPSLAQTPDEVLEIQRFVVKHGGVRLEGEELAGELGAIIRRKEGGRGGLMNNRSGQSLQHMAELAQEAGFTRSADKTELLDILDRSARQGQDVLSMHNPGLLVDVLNGDPLQAAMYYKLKALAENWDNLKETARRGTIPRTESHAMGQSLRETGEITLSRIRDMTEGTAVNAEQASAIVHVQAELFELIQKNAQDFMREPLDSSYNKVVDLLNMFGEADPRRLGMMAESGRSTGIFNDPLSGFKGYLAQFDTVVRDMPHMSKLRLMEQIASLKSVEEIADAARQVRRQSRARTANAIARQLTPEEVDTLQRAVREAAEISGRPVPAFTGDAISGEQLALIRQVQEAAASPELAGQAISGEQLDLLQRATQLVDIPPFGGQSMSAVQLALIEEAVTPEELGRAPLKDIWMEIWYNSMLSAPPGRVADVISMGLTTTWAIPERFLASALTGDIGTREGVELLYGAYEGFGDALRLAGRAFRSGQRQFGRRTVVRPGGQVVDVLPEMRIEGEIAQATGRQAVSAEGLQLSGPLGHAADWIGHAINLPRRAMLASDELFRAVNYRMELNGQTFRQARAEVRDGVLNTDGLAERIAHLRLNPTPEIAQAAEHFAYYNTFTTALKEQGAPFEMAGRFSQFFSQGVQAHPAAQVLFPFIKTPFNLTRFAGERSPLGIFSYNVLKDLAGVNGGAARGLAQAKMGLGTMVMGTVALMVQQGLITGHGPDNPRLRSRLLSTRKWQPYSFRFGDTLLGYNRFDPFAMQIGAAADLAALLGEVEEMDAARLMGALLQIGWNTMGGKTYLRQASELFESFKGTHFGSAEQVGQAGQRFAQRFVGNLLIPSGVAAVARVIDPVRRDISGKGLGFFDSLRRGIQARVPGWSSSLPARRNFWGEEQLLGMGWSDVVRNPLASFVFPMYLSEAPPFEPADEAMFALGYIPPMPERVFKSPGADPIELSPEEYDRYQLLSNGHDMPGPLLKDAMHAYVTGPAFAAHNNTQRVSTLRAMLFTDLKTKKGYRPLARARLLQEFPELGRRVEEQRRHADAQQNATGRIPLPDLPLSIGLGR